MFKFHYSQEIPVHFQDTYTTTSICVGGTCIRHYTPVYTSIPMYSNAYRSANYERNGRVYTNILPHTPEYFVVRHCYFEFIWRFVILFVFCALLLRNL